MKTTCGHQRRMCVRSHTHTHTQTKLTGHRHTLMAFVLDVVLRVWCVHCKRIQHCTIAVHDFVICIQRALFLFWFCHQKHWTMRASEWMTTREMWWERKKRRVRRKYNLVWVSSICLFAICLIKWNSIVQNNKDDNVNNNISDIAMRLSFQCTQWCSRTILLRIFVVVVVIAVFIEFNWSMKQTLSFSHSSFHHFPPL